MSISKVSKASLSRVSLYLSYLDKLDNEITNISATTIAHALNLGEVTVRKDLSSLCGQGRPKIGYDKLELINDLKSYLKEDDGETIIVGAGKLGNALLNFNGFEEYGIKIVAAFDHHPKKSIYPTDKKIYLLDELKDFLKTHKVKIAIITVPEAAAQETFDYLYSCGIRLFSCFAPVHLKTPEDAIVQYENMGLTLAHLKNSKTA